jgi:xanthine dehydrogenase accessory factor
VDIYEEIVRLKKEGRPSVLATIVQCVGSSPQKEGAKMLVRDDGSIAGTLGGGCLEAEVIQASLMAMKTGLPGIVPFQLTEDHGGLVCGGNRRPGHLSYNSRRGTRGTRPLCCGPVHRIQSDCC